MQEKRDATECVLVTGGAGFIGSHVVGMLLDAGHHVVVIDDFSTGKRENLSEWRGHPRLLVITASIADGLWSPLSALKGAPGVFGEGITRIIHLAARVSVIDSIQNPLEDLRMNSGATLHALEYARHEGVKKVVFASSAAIYGDVDIVPTSETAPLAPMSPYGIHKLTSEHYLSYFRQVHGLDTAALRFFNVYGPRQDPSSMYSGVISIFLRLATQGQPITIFGDGTQTRDFVYVGDIARALVSACLGDGYGEMNIGTGEETSVLELARLVCSTTQSEGEIKHAPARAGEILRSCAKIERAKQRLGYVPQVSLKEGLQKTAAWAHSKT